jgi:hypothetical protein
MERFFMLMDQQNQYCKNGYTIKSNVYVQCNLHQNFNDILHKDRKANPNVQMKTQKTSDSQSNSEHKKQQYRYYNS